MKQSKKKKRDKKRSYTIVKKFDNGRVEIRITGTISWFLIRAIKVSRQTRNFLSAAECERADFFESVQPIAGGFEWGRIGLVILW